jgi:hypothetical protein
MARQSHKFGLSALLRMQTEAMRPSNNNCFGETAFEFGMHKGTGCTNSQTQQGQCTSDSSDSTLGMKKESNQSLSRSHRSTESRIHLQAPQLAYHGISASSTRLSLYQPPQLACFVKGTVTTLHAIVILLWQWPGTQEATRYSSSSRASHPKANHLPPDGQPNRPPCAQFATPCNLGRKKYI